ncbi:MAG: peptidoglycan editing factor PgeF [Hyphomicrobiaceae bacterium]|nr:peptidoglycan editing factor PgeF [Hyphomicrobiaceae bacterium]
MPRPLIAPNLDGLAGIRHGFFTREGGVSTGIYAGLNCGLGSKDERAAVLENRARVARHLGAGEPVVLTAYQVHGAEAVVAEAPFSAELPKADAIVTRTPGLAIAVLTADCAPVLFADASAKVVAAAHAGWRGAVAGILEAAVSRMEELGARREQIHAAVGPTISQPAYEVGEDFEADLLSLDPGNAVYFMRPAPGARPHFDLPAYVARRLRGLGLATIHGLDTCTSKDESKFFSFRRTTRLQQSDYGRQISAIVVS